MGLQVIVLAAVGIWIAALLFVISLCRAANWSDSDMGTSDPRATAQPPPTDRTLRTLDLRQAAALLEVAPETLLLWERRYGFPTSSRLEQRYSQFEVLALRDSISDGASIAAAVARARERINRRRAPTEARVTDRRDNGLAS